MPQEKFVDAVALKPFTSTQFGNLAQGDPLTITQARFNVWKEQGLVDYPQEKPSDAVSEMPEPTPAPKPKAAPKKKAASRKGKARK